MFHCGQRILWYSGGFCLNSKTLMRINRATRLYCEIIQRNRPLIDPLKTISQEQCRSNELFNAEKDRQREQVGRIEKIEVEHIGYGEKSITLIMNRDISTPYNCAQHLSEQYCQISPLALINGKTAWDMHRPLMDNCSLQFITFTSQDPHLVNKAFWRSCSFMLGAVLSTCLKEDAQLQLHSFPGPNVRSGSFVHDIVLKSKDWKPCKNELRALSAEMIRLSGRALCFERLEVDEKVALDIFRASKYKSEQIPSIAHQYNGRITLYRLGHHIDISRGPMIASTSFLGKCTVSAVHKIADEGSDSAMYRVQGVALPTGFVLNHVAFGILEDRARKLNPARLPNEPFQDTFLQIA